MSVYALASEVGPQDVNLTTCLAGLAIATQRSVRTARSAPEGFASHMPQSVCHHGA